jgi:hypothetical protein
LGPPPIPGETVQEGARWRHHAPTTAQVAEWFKSVPLDKEFADAHDRFISGVVIIPQSGKVKYATANGTTERYEMTFTPYMQIGTRLAYAHQLADERELVLRIAPLPVPRLDKQESPYHNANLGEGLWWHVVKDGEGNIVRYLCATQAVQFYERDEYYRAERHPDTKAVVWESIMPLLEGQGTKQVSGGTDMNAVMKAQTGAIGRALGVAGILVLGTGIATAEDMQEFSGQAAAAPELPSVAAAPTEIAAGTAPEPPEEREERLTHFRARAMAAETRLHELGAAGTWNSWWDSRAGIEGWQGLGDVPLEALEGIVVRLDQAVSNAEAQGPAVEAAPVQ